MLRSECASPAALGLDVGRGAHLLRSAINNQIVHEKCQLTDNRCRSLHSPDEAAELAGILALSTVRSVSTVPPRRQNNPWL